MPFEIEKVSTMKTANNWLTTIIVFIVGVLLIVWHGRLDVLQWIVMAVGLMLVIPGAYSFISAIARRSHVQGEYSAASSTIVASLGALALGIWMLVTPAFFVGLLAYIFGAILFLYGIFHIVVIRFWSSPYVLPWWFYVIPVLMIVAGVVILCSSVRDMDSAVVLIMGISLVASSINSVLEHVSTHPSRTRDAA